MTSRAKSVGRNRSSVAASGAAIALLVAAASLAQSQQAPATDSSPGRQHVAKERQPVDPGTLSCSALKAELGKSGELGILSGPRGAWSDTFYGPAAPRCDFWQIPEFTYVRARDGLCGVGYICIEKPTVY